MRNRAKILKEIISVCKSIIALVREREFNTISNRKRNRILRLAYKEIQAYENELLTINTHIDYMCEINPVCYIEITNFTEEKLLLLKERINRMNTEAKMSGSFLYLRVLEAELKEVIEICKQLKINVIRIPFDQLDNLIDGFGYDY